MLKFILVFAGGGAGSLLRYSLGFMLPRQADGFPWATFAANVMACIVIALVAYVFKERLQTMGTLLLATGFCGGLSTFSTFSFETVELINRGLFSTALLYIFSSLILCLLTVLAISRMV
jgi:CrcB protein